MPNGIKETVKRQNTDHATHQVKFQLWGLYEVHTPDYDEWKDQTKSNDAAQENQLRRWQACCR
jgi:hypothetical protein